MAVWNAATWIILSSYSFASSAIIYRSLGAAQFGIWATILALRSMLFFVDSGLGLAVTRDTTLAKGNDEAARRLVAARVVYGILAVGAVILALPVSALLGHFLGLTGRLEESARAVAMIIGLESALAMIASPMAATLRGRERFDIVALFAGLQAVVGIYLMAVLVPRHGLIGVGIAIIVGRLSSVVLLSGYMGLSVKALVEGTHVSLRVLKGLLRFVLPLWAIGIGSQIGMRTDLPIVGGFYGASKAGQYALGSGVAAVAASLLFVLLDAAYPRLSSLSSMNAAALTETLLKLGCAFSGLGFGTLILNGSILLIAWVGIAPPLALTVLVLYSVSWCMNVPTHVLSLAAIGRGRHHILGPIVLVESVANLLLSLVFAIALGPIGPAIGTLVTLSVTNLVVIPGFLRSRLSLRLAAIGRLVVSGYALGGMLSVVVWLGTRRLTGSLPERLGAVILGTTLAALAVTLILLRSRPQLIPVIAAADAAPIRGLKG